MTWKTMWIIGKCIDNQGNQKSILLSDMIPVVFHLFYVDLGSPIMSMGGTFNTSPQFSLPLIMDGSLSWLNANYYNLI